MHRSFSVIDDALTNESRRRITFDKHRMDAKSRGEFGLADHYAACIKESFRTSVRLANEALEAMKETLTTVNTGGQQC
jgi:hypothetical protein